MPQLASWSRLRRLSTARTSNGQPSPAGIGNPASARPPRRRPVTLRALSGAQPRQRRHSPAALPSAARVAHRRLALKLPMRFTAGSTSLERCHHSVEAVFSAASF
jgi:hypothetical protein